MQIDLIKAPTEADWALVKDCTLVTVGKRATTPPTSEWKHRILEARHSPIRELRFVFRLEVPYWVAMHLVRHHVGCQPYVRTQRNDRQRVYDRTSAPQDAPVDMIWSVNAEALQVIANKRLCLAAAVETRAVVRSMCQLAIEACPELDGLLVPMCVHNGGKCHEFTPCGQQDLLVRGNGL